MNEKLRKLGNSRFMPLLCCRLTHMHNNLTQMHNLANHAHQPKEDRCNLQKSGAEYQIAASFPHMLLPVQESIQLYQSSLKLYPFPTTINTKQILFNAQEPSSLQCKTSRPEGPAWTFDKRKLKTNSCHFFFYMLPSGTES